eukprot:489400_1
MAAHIHTITDEEGIDELKQFLLSNKNKLKNAVDPIYQLLTDEDIDYEELMEYAEVDLRSILTENANIKLKSTQIGRLINVLRNTAESTIHKQSKKEKIVIVLSDQENNALNNIKHKIEQITKHKETVTDTINILNNNKINCKKQIDQQITYMIQMLQKRQKELVIQLDTIVKDKTTKLTKQLINLQNDESKMNECYNKCKAMVENTTLDSSTRKSKILANTKVVLQDKNIVSYNDFHVISSADIITKIDINDAVNAIKLCGSILSTDKALPPKIKIQSVQDKSVELSITTNVDDIIGFRLKYAKCDEEVKENMDDVKMDWKSIDINKCEKNVNYSIKSLRPFTKYLLYGICKNIKGFGYPSKAIAFETKKEAECWSQYGDNMIVNVQQKSVSYVANKSGHNSAFLSQLVESGANSWRFKLLECSGNKWNNVIGIWKVTTQEPPINS